MFNRRRFLTAAGAVAARPGRVAMAGAGAMLAACSGQRVEGLTALAAKADETTGLPLIKLPPEFRYMSFSWTDDALRDGSPVPGLHDGMGAILRENGEVVDLVRNHEIDAQAPFASPSVYDPGAGGGTTTLAFDTARGEWLDAVGSLSGTIRNCAGGTTPWGTWLTCEETDRLAGGPLSMPHGYVFEVGPDAPGTAMPLRSMGRFRHEAVVVDPLTDHIYLTEDERRGGLYRFTPSRPGGQGLASGRLEMLAVIGSPQDDSIWRVGERHAVHWVPIDDPDAQRQRVFDQGFERGGKRFKRLEGAALSGRDLLFVSTTGGVLKNGQIYSLDLDAGELTLAFESWSDAVLDEPDNVAAVGRELIICENGERSPTRMSMLTKDGVIRVFAENNVLLDGFRGLEGDYRDVEWCGACFVNDWLFANIQSPGFTVAITGPWDDWFR